MRMAKRRRNRRQRPQRTPKRQEREEERPQTGSEGSLPEESNRVWIYTYTRYKRASSSK